MHQNGKWIPALPKYFTVTAKQWLVFHMFRNSGSSYPWKICICLHLFHILSCIYLIPKKKVFKSILFSLTLKISCTSYFHQPSVRCFYNSSLDIIWKNTPVYIRSHCWQCTSEHKPIHEIKGIICDLWSLHHS